MKNKLFIKLLFLLFLGVIFASCQKEYYDTKDYGESILDNNAKNDSVNLYNTVYDTTIVGTDTTITSKKVFYKRAALHVLADGLQYAVYYDNSYGISSRADIANYAKINYTAMYINGTVFETGTNSVKLYSGLPSGLQEAIRKMNIGEKWRVWVPYGLGYGTSGETNSDGSYKVDPYSALIYDIELLATSY